MRKCKQENVGSSKRLLFPSALRQNQLGEITYFPCPPHLSPESSVSTALEVVPMALSVEAGQWESLTSCNHKGRTNICQRAI